MKQLQPKMILAIGIPCSLLLNLFVSLPLAYVFGSEMENWLDVGVALGGERMVAGERPSFYCNGVDSLPHWKVRW